MSDFHLMKETVLEIRLHGISVLPYSRDPLRTRSCSPSTLSLSLSLSLCLSGGLCSFRTLRIVRFLLDNLRSRSFFARVRPRCFSFSFPFVPLSATPHASIREHRGIPFFYPLFSPDETRGRATERKRSEILLIEYQSSIRLSCQLRWVFQRH